MHDAAASATPRPTVVVAWDVSLDPSVLAPLHAVADVRVIPETAEALRAALPDADVYLTTLKTRLDGPMIALARRLKIVGTATTGLDHLDLDALARRGVQVVSIKTEFDLLDQITSTAELAWGLLLATVRKIPAGHASACRGVWGRDRFRGRMLNGMTLGIVGVGRLGTMMIDYGRAFRMNVIGTDPAPRKTAPGITYVGLDKLLQTADVVSLHVHLNDQTRHMIGRRELALMKPGAYLINTSRGGLIDESALLESLQSGHLAGAGLDVIDGEWRTDLDQHPLIQYAATHENLIISPHVGGLSVEAMTMTQAFVARKVAGMVG